MIGFNMPRNLIIVTYSFLFNLFHMYFLFHFVGHIYGVLSPRNNAWGSEYQLSHCLDGNKTLIEPVTNDENNKFMTGSMVVKGEYLTVASHKKKKDGYVYQDYKLGSIVYHFTNLIVGKNIKLHTLFKKNNTWV